MQFLIEKNKKTLHSYLVCMLFSSWLGTYLELICTGRQLYTFEKRPYADIFAIDIRLTLMLIPLLTLSMLYLTNKMKLIDKILLTSIASLLIAFTEPILSKYGWITYSEQWRHMYSFFGYFAFLSINILLFKWMNSRSQ